MDIFDARTVWPGWKTVRRIGRGSYGAVYEIERDVFGHTEKAALKFMTIPQNESDIDELLNDGYDEKSITARFNDCLQDIVREYTMMSEMKGCANIVYCDDVKYVKRSGSIGWNILIKMELLEPVTKLFGKDVTDSQVIKFASDICNALSYCEKRHVLHRDIKPQNIFVSQDGTYKLGDFGIAKTVDHTTSGTKTGTYKYMAPEVYNNQPYWTKADIYSLGLVMYWLLNERRAPFLPLPPKTPAATDEDEARRRRLSGEKIPAPVHGSNELKRIVLKACAYDQNDRYMNADEMKADLEKLLWKEKNNNSKITGAADENNPDSDETISIFEEIKVRTEKKSDGNYASASIINPNTNINRSEENESALKKTELDKKVQKRETEYKNLKSVKAGDTILFGSYIQKGIDKTSVEWLVLKREESRILVISKYSLDCKPYNKSCAPYKRSTERVTWEICSLRKWLNGTFVETAFSKEEQEMVENTKVSADKNPYHRTNSGKDTTDKVFLLSINEVEKYFASDDSRVCAPTEYAASRYAYTGPGSSWWWLRSPGNRQNDAATVYSDGRVNYYGDLVSMAQCVRPAMWIKVP